VRVIKHFNTFFRIKSNTNVFKDEPEDHNSTFRLNRDENLTGESNFQIHQQANRWNPDQVTTPKPTAIPRVKLVNGGVNNANRDKCSPTVISESELTCKSDIQPKRTYANTSETASMFSQAEPTPKRNNYLSGLLPVPEGQGNCPFSATQSTSSGIQRQTPLLNKPIMASTPYPHSAGKSGTFQCLNDN